MAAETTVINVVVVVVVVVGEAVVQCSAFGHANLRTLVRYPDIR